MLLLDFIKWWYGPGWVLRAKMLLRHVENWLEYFSVGTLLKTMFSPWRQNISAARQDQAIQAKFNAFIDNIISRLVGFTVRVFALVAAVVTLVIVFVFNLIIILAWPFIPILPAILIGVGASL